MDQCIIHNSLMDQLVKIGKIILLDLKLRSKKNKILLKSRKYYY